MTALWLLGALVVALWCLQPMPLRWPQGIGIFSVLAAGILTRRWWRTQCLGTLRWDGTQWELAVQAARSTGTVSVQLDLQQHLLLRLSRPASEGQVWLWLEQASDPVLWSDLRRAVYSPARSPDAEPNVTAAS